MAEDSLIKYNIAVLGAGTVGKSALIYRLQNNQFIEEYDATISDESKCAIKVDGVVEMIKILDTAGQENFAYLRKQWLEGRNGALLVFSIENQKSFQELKEIMEDVVKQKGENFPIVVCGNKNDLNENRMVLADKAKEFLKAYKDVPYFETSAKTGDHVTEVFQSLCRRMKGILKPQKKKKSLCRVL